MHIPDGYLSPSTCAALYVCAGAGWYAALRRTRERLLTRTIPLISVFAAFSFVVMMFNLPLPGGTTAHATGVAIAAIVLGPSAGILAISIALAIQAMFFGDGGLTTLGANCFNIAIAGILVAWGCYRLLAGRSAISSRRRVIAAAIAGYTAINVSALLTAIEFGIQPRFFHDPIGVPLYAPYPLHIAIPAVMIGHLTLAGCAEAIVSAGMVSYLQLSHPSLLESSQSLEGAVRSARPVWATVAVLMLLTPLGILATGVAWGEWAPSDFAHAATSRQSTGPSRDALPPATVPAGLQKLSGVWTAPFPAYSPSFIRRPEVGYMLSAMFAAGLLFLTSLLLMYFAKRWSRRELRS